MDATRLRPVYMVVYEKRFTLRLRMRGVMSRRDFMVDFPELSARQVRSVLSHCAFYTIGEMRWRLYGWSPRALRRRWDELRVDRQRVASALGTASMKKRWGHGVQP